MHHDNEAPVALIAAALQTSAAFADRELPVLAGLRPDLEDELDALQKAIGSGDLFDDACLDLVDALVGALAEGHDPRPVRIVRVEYGECDSCDERIDPNPQDVRVIAQAIGALREVRSVLARIQRLRRAREIARELFFAD